LKSRSARLSRRYFKSISQSFESRVNIGGYRSSSQAASLSEQRLARAALSGVVVLAIVLRVASVLLVPSLNWADEIFQATEQAHRLVYGTGLVPWEFQLGARSWLLPGFIAGLMRLARVVGDGPDYYLPMIANALATLGAAPAVCCFLWCRRHFGVSGAFVGGAIVAVAPELIYFSPRSLSEVIAGNLLVVALYVLEPGYRVTSLRRYFFGGALLGLVFVTRIQLAPAVLVIALWTSWRALPRQVLALLVGAAAVLSLAAILDSMTLGYPLASLWRYTRYNIYFGVSSSFGIEPWHYYLDVELGVWRGALAFLLLLAMLGARRLPLVLAAAVTILAVHSMIPHKEYRFIYPALVLVMLLAGTGFAELVSWRAHRLRVGAAMPLRIATSLGVWFLISFVVWTAPTLAGLRDRAHDSLLAASFVARGPAPCGIGLYGLSGDDWAAYGGYTHFHRPAPMYWPKDEAALAEAAGAFDTLLYTKPPPASLGFTTRQCIGEVCVAQRSGGCRTVPMTPLPLPDPLVELTGH
jgi:phosphatidylinositol glycan class B